MREIPSLLKIVADGHMKSVKFGFKIYHSVVEGRDDGAYAVLSDSYLAYLRYELARSYSREAFRVCANPKCRSIIVCNTDTNNTEQFCSAVCRAQANNAKISGQNKRARKSYYAGNDILTIYRDAFGSDHDDSDGAGLERLHRLRRRIDNDFSKTRRGEVAKKNGAGRIKAKRMVN